MLLVGGLLASWLLDLGSRGVALVGDIPRGLPSFEVPDTASLAGDVGTAAAAAVALVLIGFSQTAGDARAFAAKHRYEVDIDQESVAQGMANVGAGFLQGMPVSTSLSASALNDRSGARSGLASITSGVTVLLTLVVLAPLFSVLPKAVLAALIIEAVVSGMMDVPGMRRLRQVHRVDFWVALAALVGALVFGVLVGVLIGIALSLLWLVAVATHPQIPELGRESGTQVFRDLRDHPEDTEEPGIAVVRLDGGLFFATTDALESRVRDVLRSRAEVHGLVLDCAGLNFVDAQGSATLDEIRLITEAAGADLRLAALKGAVRETLELDGVLDRLGRDRVHGNVHRAVEAQRAARAGEASDDPSR